jgi:hypothetical protein
MEKTGPGDGHEKRYAVTDYQLEWYGIYAVNSATGFRVQTSSGYISCSVSQFPLSEWLDGNWKVIGGNPFGNISQTSLNNTPNFTKGK